MFSIATVERTFAGGREYNEDRSEEHTSELQSLRQLVCRLLLEKKKQCRVTVPHGGCQRDRGPRSDAWEQGRGCGLLRRQDDQADRRHRPCRRLRPVWAACRPASRALHSRQTSRRRLAYALFFLILRQPPRSTLFPYTTLFR